MQSPSPILWSRAWLWGVYNAEMVWSKIKILLITANFRIIFLKAKQITYDFLSLRVGWGGVGVTVISTFNR